MNGFRIVVWLGKAAGRGFGPLGGLLIATVIAGLGYTAGKVTNKSHRR